MESSNIIVEYSTALSLRIWSCLYLNVLFMIGWPLQHMGKPFYWSLSPRDHLMRIHLRWWRFLAKLTFNEFIWRIFFFMYLFLSDIFIYIKIETPNKYSYPRLSPFFLPSPSLVLLQLTLTHCLFRLFTFLISFLARLASLSLCLFTPNLTTKINFASLSQSFLEESLFPRPLLLGNWTALPPWEPPFYFLKVLYGLLAKKKYKITTHLWAEQEPYKALILFYSY